jgi:hypothetical protein
MRFTSFVPPILTLAGAFSALAAAPAPTFYKDVLPILQSRCQECHRPGELGPMALQTYQQARPYAASIKEQVLARKMPPWDADPHVGHFANDRSLSQPEIDTLAAWAATGAKEGRPADAPAPRTFVSGWNIEKPDLEFKMAQPFHVPATGTVDYQYIVIPTQFKEDTWVRMAEVRPSARSVVHHAVVFVREPGNKWLRGEAEPNVPFSTPDGVKRGDIGGLGSDLLLTYTPGMVPEIWKPGQARLIPAGSDLVLQLHYTPNGKAVDDQTTIGLVFAKEPPKERVLSVFASNSNFAIPPGDANYEVVSRYTFRNPGVITALFPHMHLRGKDFEFRVIYPDGKTETLLRVPNYRFHWQLSYKLETPLAVPANTRVEGIAHFDNSPNNPWNPDPTATVHFGEQSSEEMLVGFIDVAIDASVSRSAFARPARPAVAK